MLDKRYRVDGDTAEDDVPPHKVAPGRVPRTIGLLPAVLFRKPGAGGIDDGAEDAVARAADSSGAPLPADVRARFEGSLGADLSSVRVHTGRDSAAAAAAVGARAYTVGNDIHFAAGAYAPADPFGLHLLAHEVAHTQQRGAPVIARKEDGAAKPGDAQELSDLRKQLIAEFDEFNGKVVGDKEYDAIMSQQGWDDQKNKEMLQEVGHVLSYGAVAPPAIYTTCIGTQAVLLSKALTVCKLKPKDTYHTEFSHYMKDPKVFHKASAGMSERPRPADILILSSEGGGVDSATRNDAFAKTQVDDATQREGQAQQRLATAQAAVDAAKQALADLQATEADPKANPNVVKAKIATARAAVATATQNLTTWTGMEGRTAKNLQNAKDTEAKTAAKVEEERAKNKQGPQYFDFRHTCFLAGAITKGEDGKEHWPVFGGGATLDNTDDSKKGGGAEKAGLIYDPATNELSDPTGKAGTTWLWGWCDPDKMAV